LAQAADSVHHSEASTMLLFSVLDWALYRWPFGMGLLPHK
jgi:hypothetical protein